MNVIVAQKQSYSVIDVITVEKSIQSTSNHVPSVCYLITAHANAKNWIGRPTKKNAFRGKTIYHNMPISFPILLKYTKITLVCYSKKVKVFV
jgi:hypothetical protein